MKMIHTLKTLDSVFPDVDSGAKTFEIRYDDRGFKVGDVLQLKEISSGKNIAQVDTLYTGRECLREVTYILSGQEWGLLPGYCILGIKRVENDRI